MDWYRNIDRRKSSKGLEGHRRMADKSNTAVFTGAEVALADALVLVMDVLVLHGIMKSDALGSVFAFLEERYRSAGLNSSAAMAQYLRDHLAHPDPTVTHARLLARLDKAGGTVGRRWGRPGGGGPRTCGPWRTPMLQFELLRNQGILVITPDGPLEEADFQRLAKEIDPFIAANGKLAGVMICAKSFPG